MAFPYNIKYSGIFRGIVIFCYSKNMNRFLLLFVILLYLRSNKVKNAMSYKSVKEVVTMLLDNGFILKSQKGSHMKFEKDGITVVVPNHGKKGVEKGTYYSIMRQAGLK